MICFFVLNCLAWSTILKDLPLSYLTQNSLVWRYLPKGIFQEHLQVNILVVAGSGNSSQLGKQ